MWSTTLVLELIALSALFSALFERALAVPQDSEGPISSDPSPCGGCVLVADVAAIVWYSQIFVQTDTQIVAISVGNVTRSTSSSLIQNRAQYTIVPTATTEGGNSIAMTAIDYSPTINIGGATLSSPTAYNVFSAYTYTTMAESGGICAPNIYSSSLTSAYSEPLSSASGQVTLDRNGEQQFISFVGLTDCVPGSASVTATAHIQVSALTKTSTITGPLPTAAAAHTTSSAPSSTSSSSSSSVFLGSPNSFTPAISSTTTKTSVIATASISLSNPNATSDVNSSPATISLAPLPMIVLNGATLTPLSSSKTIAVGNITATANSAGAYVFPGSLTLAPGASLTLSVSPGVNATIAAFTGDAGYKRVGLWSLLWITISAGILASGWIT